MILATSQAARVSHGSNPAENEAGACDQRYGVRAGRSLFLSVRLTRGAAAPAEAYDNAGFGAKGIRETAREASPVDLSSAFIDANDPAQVNAVLDEALRTDSGLNTLLQSIVGYSPTIADAAITRSEEHTSELQS